MTAIKTKKQQIYEAAARLFRDKGYPATSMRHLAEAVDLKASSLYNHIGSKEDLLRDICFENAHKFLTHLKTVSESDLSHLEKVKALIELHLTMATEELTSVTAFNDEWRHLSEPWLSDFVQLRKDYEKGFLKIIQEGIQAGEIQAADPQTLLYTLLSAMRWLYDWVKPDKPMATDSVKQELAGFLVRGLVK
ncbi:MAG: TetR/AcrR family transcriptional regulator [Saprospiraceae bacterium]|jgi:TetR/AcrR family transcriptional regulator, cholesterol catabolism regulator|nr:TetR/AcrR family transcriptional regulator [Saprospiraceae bacterium]MDP4820422.1 TetR/AcrR family transcriptional regulator [Saprospiraceae bacterium]MDP4999914.1 TetR/AcrR family transcriptional regulator [Saprospiraceae bacterium]